MEIEPTEGTKYDLWINGRTQVTEANMDDVLGNGVFAFDGDKTLFVRGDFETDRLVIKNSIDGLVIQSSGSYTLKSTQSAVLETDKDVTVQGESGLSFYGSDVTACVNLNNGANLSLNKLNFFASGGYAIRGSEGSKLTVIQSTVGLCGESFAYTDISGGIVLKNCRVTDSYIHLGSTPRSDYASKVPYVEIQPYSNPFADVAEGAYYYDAVLWAVNAKPQITAGTDATHFSPLDHCTRAQVVTFLWRAEGKPEPQQTSCPFTDVNDKAFYYQAVLWAVQNKITSGTSASTFSPNEYCTRGQVVTFLWRTAGKPEPGESAVGGAPQNPFTDVKESNFFYKAVLWAVEQEITKGTSSTTFSPNQICTRGQVVTFLYRYKNPEAAG